MTRTIRSYAAVLFIVLIGLMTTATGSAHAATAPNAQLLWSYANGHRYHGAQVFTGFGPVACSTCGSLVARKGHMVVRITPNERILSAEALYVRADGKPRYVHWNGVTKLPTERKFRIGGKAIGAELVYAGINLYNSSVPAPGMCGTNC